MSLYQDEDAENTLADFGLHQLSAPLNPTNHIDPSTAPTASGFLHLHPNPPFSKPISDPDLFLSSLYNYYHKRGLGPIIGSGVVELCSLFFTLYLSYVIGACLDWNSLRTCHDENTCSENFNEYWIHSPLLSHEHSLAKKAWIVIYCLLFMCYGIVCMVQFGYSVMASLESKLFMEEVLAVQDEDLTMGKVEWGEIVERMEKRSDVMRRKLGVMQWRQQQQESSEQFTSCHLVVAQRIMRRENFMIAFFNLGLLDLTLPNLIPDWTPYPIQQWLGNSRLILESQHKKHIFYSKSIEWSIYFCVLNYMFNHSRKIRPAFYADSSSLQKRFILCGVAHLFFMPFLLFFVTIHFFMANVYDWQSTKEYLGPREWSVVAQWKFREFNELPHLFERRLEPSYKCASTYIDMFRKPSALSIATGRLLVFISGSLGTLLLAFAAINDAILLHVKIYNWNLLWYAGVLGASFSIGKGMLPKATSPYSGHFRRNLVDDMNSELEKIATHTHYFPDEWRGKACEDSTKNSFSTMFRYKAVHFASEVLSIIVAPLILCISLPRCADRLCSFVRDSKLEVPGVGDVVGYSTFDFDAFEDENWIGKGETADGAWDQLQQNIAGNGRPKSKHGKMEKSFFNFKSAYPRWKLPPSGKNLVDLVENFRQQQENALAHERRLHIEAAAAQLLTLQRLETERGRRSSEGLVVIDEHVKVAPADSGGGGSPGNIRNHSSQSDFSSMASFNDDLHHPHVHFEESAHSLAPPTHAFTHSSMFQSRTHDQSRRMSSPSRRGDTSVMHYADAGLSMELRGLLDGMDQSFTGSLVPVDEGAASILDMRTDQQIVIIQTQPIYKGKEVICNTNHVMSFRDTAERRQTRPATQNMKALATLKNKRKRIEDKIK